VYVKAGDVPASVHATEQRSTTSFKPLVVSVSSRLDGDALVVRSMEPRLVPDVRSKARCIVSPGTNPVAATVSRLVTAPVAPKESVTVPDDTGSDADVLDVNVAKVPSATMAAAEPSTAPERMNLRIVLLGDRTPTPP
jgi:hypothetical protein